MKKLIYRVFFFISLLPYAAIFSYAIYSAISGIGYIFLFSSTTIYGFEGFLYTLIIGIIWLVYYPVLPICLTYQISYLACRKRDKKKPIWISTIAVAVISISLVFGLKAVNNMSKQNLELEYYRKEETVKNSVSEMVKKADEIIPYYGDGAIHGDGIAGTEFTQATIFIDYESKRIAFLLYVHGAEYWEYTLSKDITIQSDKVQYRKELKNPGGTLTAFYHNDEAKHETIALQLIMEDGSVYAIDNIKDKFNRNGLFLGLQWAQLENKNEVKYNSIIGEWETNIEGVIMKIVFYDRNQFYIEENGIRTEEYYQLESDGFISFSDGVRRKIEIKDETMTFSTITDSETNLIEFKKK
jgi:hypothetical protein